MEFQIDEFDGGNNTGSVGQDWQLATLSVDLEHVYRGNTQGVECLGRLPDSIMSQASVFSALASTDADIGSQRLRYSCCRPSSKPVGQKAPQPLGLIQANLDLRDLR